MKTLILLNVILSVIILSNQVNVKIYDIPGIYELKPEDYNYQDSILIQMWGAGSGSTYNTQGNYIYVYGGNSGAYIFANISTLYNETFYITIGKGGIYPYYISIPGAQCFPNKFIGYNGGSTIFSLSDNSLLLNVSGGIAYYLNSQNKIVYDNTTIISTHRARDTIITQSNGFIYTFDASSDYVFNYYGASSPFGLLGGYGYQYKAVDTCNGKWGSGAGVWCNYQPNNKTLQYYQGGDGALILYY